MISSAIFSSSGDGWCMRSFTIPKRIDIVDNAVQPAERVEFLIVE